MNKQIAALAVLAGIALAGCSAPIQQAAPVVEVERVGDVSAEQRQTMLGDLRPVLVELEASDAAIYREAYEACANLLIRDRDAYREAVIEQYPSIELALDHLSVAAAAKKYICP
ncbi:hypothetical protein [Pseudarthrobacter sp. PS3-L1]|uniref:hypothetical protein n=1 Tax=Pseudarthrobacter sp. PS3-L1 TaxID=3046207 RepID=UPI0024BB9C2E|nr:hypothetical protein [Pseudarthrobacter sp. PS3-L1]MDJ0321652.1 hypothetical protein [Pseudarthrobacter sp. PS3-L1]